MKRRIGRHHVGERYLLQFPGGIERLVEVSRVADAGGEPAFQPLRPEDQLPGRPLPGGEWLVDSGERLIRDWTGTYWSVDTSGSARIPGELPVACHIVFTRHTPAGERFTYRAASLWHPEELGDEDLASMLRRAWETLDTDPEERRRRSGGGIAVEL